MTVQATMITGMALFPCFVITDLPLVGPDAGAYHAVWCILMIYGTFTAVGPGLGGGTGSAMGQP